MTPCSRFDAALDDFVDGTLTPAEWRDVETHLAECERCRQDVEARRALAREVARLPRAIDPPRDFLPAIRAARARSAAPRPRAIWLAAAASVAGIALAGIVGYRMGTQRVAPQAAMARVSFDAAERDYAQAAASLTAVLDGHLATLTPETRATILAGLDELDRAIEDLRVVLNADPANLETGRSWNALQRRRIHFLRTVSRLSS